MGRWAVYVGVGGWWQRLAFSGNVSVMTLDEVISFLATNGLGGVLTFKNAGLAEIIREVPMAQLVLETDAPFLAPALKTVAAKKRKRVGAPRQRSTSVSKSSSVAADSGGL